MIESVLLVKAMCLAFTVTASPPDFWLSKSRKNLACESSAQIVKESRALDIDPTLIMALITVESNWKRTAVSRADACGLTQVIPKYTGRITKKHTCEQLKVPKNSIYVGIKTLKFWLNFHKGNVPRGLCSYNAGFRCSYKRNKKGKIIKRPTRHGMRYARKVLKIKEKIDRNVGFHIDKLR